MAKPDPPVAGHDCEDDCHSETTRRLGFFENGAVEYGESRLPSRTFKPDHAGTPGWGRAQTPEFLGLSKTETGNGNDRTK